LAAIEEQLSSLTLPRVDDWKRRTMLARAAVLMMKRVQVCSRPGAEVESVGGEKDFQVATWRKLSLSLLRRRNGEP
jgi:hypothetical protein